MMRGYTGGHLGAGLEDYVDGVMSPEQESAAARHLVACRPCREDVEAERDILRRVRAVEIDPGRQADLVAGLLAFSPPASPPKPDVRANLPVVSPAAPAQYERHRRGQLVGLAAVALGCAGLVTSVSVHPQRTAPGAGTGTQLSSRHTLTDELADPQVTYATAAVHGVPWVSRSTSALMVKRTSSGTIGP